MKSKFDTVFTTVGRLIAVTIIFSALAQCGQAQATNFDFSATQAAADKGDAQAQYERKDCSLMIMSLAWV
jgi:hypothetical protein